MKYCISCGQNVEPVKKFSIGWFLFDCLTIVGGGIYILYWAFAKKKTCPICGGSQFSKAFSKREIDQLNKGKHIELTPEISGGDKFINGLDNFNNKMESFDLKMKESTARMQEKNKIMKEETKARKQAREEKKRLKVQRKLERVKGN